MTEEGPTSGAEDPESAEAELRRYEEERRERIRRGNRTSLPVVGWIMVVALATLAYDAAVRAERLRGAGGPWAPHAALASISAVAVLVLLFVLIRVIVRRRRS